MLPYHVSYSPGEHTDIPNSWSNLCLSSTASLLREEFTWMSSKWRCLRHLKVTRYCVKDFQVIGHLPAEKKRLPWTLLQSPCADQQRRFVKNTSETASWIWRRGNQNDLRDFSWILSWKAFTLTKFWFYVAESRLRASTKTDIFICVTELKAGLGSQEKGFNYHFFNHILPTASAAYFDDCSCCHLFSASKQEGKIRCVWVLFAGENIVFLLHVL